MLENLVKTTPPKSESVVDETISRKDQELAWLAGFVDGEGCISAYIEKSRLNKSKKVLDCRIKIVNSDMRAIKRISEIYVNNKIGFYYAVNSYKFCAVEIIVSGRGRITKLLNLLIPHLVIKKNQAEFLLALYKRRDAFGYKSKPNRQDFLNDKEINNLVEKIKTEKKIRHNPLVCNRVANKVLGIPRDYTLPTFLSEDIVHSL